MTPLVCAWHVLCRHRRQQQRHGCHVPDHEGVPLRAQTCVLPSLNSITLSVTALITEVILGFLPRTSTHSRLLRGKPFLSTLARSRFSRGLVPLIWLR